MKRTWILLVAMTTLVCNQTKAQSADYARSLISAGRDGEAARVIRALAEKGDAEGQYLAATFFLEGKGGMNKSEQQAVKFFKLSADQGYDKSINGLIEYYVNKDQWEDAFMNAVKYCGKHPYLKNKYPGYINGLCRVCGFGTRQNEDQGWEMLENNEYFERAQNNYPDSWTAYKQRHPERFRVYDTVDQMPSFPGGAAALNQYLSNEINYPAICISNKIQGRVIVSFVINRNGSVSDAKIVRSIDPALDKEALRVVRKMPNWNPGMQNGKPVSTKYTIPISFRL